MVGYLFFFNSGRGGGGPQFTLFRLVWYDVNNYGGGGLLRVNIHVCCGAKKLLSGFCNTIMSSRGERIISDIQSNRMVKNTLLI